MWQLLEWAEAGADRPVLTACQEMTVGGLLGLGLPGGVGRPKMQAYADAVFDDTFDIDSAGADIAKALRWGHALHRLSPINAGVLRRIVKQNSQYDHLELLTTLVGDVTDDFVDLPDDRARAADGLRRRGQLLRQPAPRWQGSPDAQGRHQARAQLPPLPRHEPDGAPERLEHRQYLGPAVHARALPGARPQRRVPPRPPHRRGDHEPEELHAGDRGRNQPGGDHGPPAGPRQRLRQARRRGRAPPAAGDDRRPRPEPQHGAGRRRGRRATRATRTRPPATGPKTSTSTPTRRPRRRCSTRCWARWTRPTRTRGSC